MNLYCSFCGAESELDAAVELGWILSFWEVDMEHDCPCCPLCQTELLNLDSDGEYSLREPMSIIVEVTT